MAKEPFSPAGVNTKRDDLYALADNLLALQADNIRKDLKSWVRDNFTLDAAQEDYLNSFSADFLKGLSAELSAAVENRYPIILIITGNPSGTKLFIYDKSADGEFNPAAPGSVSGRLELKVIYR